MDNTIRLTNGVETFLCAIDTRDELGPVRAMSSNGSFYDRCEGYGCEHEHAPAGATVWHDEESAQEELWTAA